MRGHLQNEDPHLLQPRVGAIISNSSHATPKDWMVDSCASFHMTADRSAFSSYRPLNHRESVEAVFGHQKRPSGIGTVILQVEGGELVLQDVRHIPHLTTKSNIISLGRLVREGYRIGGSTPTLDKQFTFSSPDGREFRAELANNDVYRILSCKAASVSIRGSPMPLASTPIPNSRARKRRGRPPGTRDKARKTRPGP
jgi:hypothetical protein